MALNEGRVGDENGRAERDPRIERLYRDAARQEPPARLDAAILAAARREVGAGPRPLAWKLRRWHVPISIAAVVVVSVSLVILVQEEEGKRETARAVEAVPTPAELPAAPAAPRTLPPAATEARQREIEAPASSRRDLQRDAAEAVARSKLADDLRSQQAPPAVAGGSVEAMPARKPAPEPSRAAPFPEGRGPGERPEADLDTAGRMASAPTAPRESYSATPSLEEKQAAPMAGAIAKRAIEQERPPVWHGFDKAPPEKWLARIEELRAQGRGPEAQEMLSEFKRRFPDHPLPSSLR